MACYHSKTVVPSSSIYLGSDSLLEDSQHLEARVRPILVVPYILPWPGVVILHECNPNLPNASRSKPISDPLLSPRK